MEMVARVSQLQVTTEFPPPLALGPPLHSNVLTVERLCTVHNTETTILFGPEAQTRGGTFVAK